MFRLFIILICCLFLSCQTESRRDYQSWKKQRLEALKAPYGWPSVVGLFPLKVTYSFFGSSDTNEFIIENAPSSFGHLEKTDSTIYMRTWKSLDVFIEGERLDKATMHSDISPEGPTKATFRSLEWYILERGEDYFLRVKDTLSTYREALTEIPYFPYNSSHKVMASAVAGGAEDSISYTNVLGQTITRQVAAKLFFDWEGQEFQLTALDNDEDSYFIMINDGTTGLTTYGGGRYLYPNKPDSTGIVTLDFNKLINPPCVFTPYATCPLPPKSNHLPFKIEAGEKLLHLY